MVFLTRNEYNAEPADIWSCGMVLVAMLTGELPWDKPTPDQVLYILFFVTQVPTQLPVGLGAVVCIFSINDQSFEKKIFPRNYFLEGPRTS